MICYSKRSSLMTISKKSFVLALPVFIALQAGVTFTMDELPQFYVHDDQYGPMAGPEKTPALEPLPYQKIEAVEPKKLFGILENNSLSESEKIELLQSHFDHFADIDAVNGRGDTLLCIAARDGLLTLVKFLIKQGANPNKTRDVYPPLACRIGSYNIAIARYLCLHGTDINNAVTHELFSLVSAGNNLKAIITFIELGIDIPTFTPKARKIRNYLILARTLYDIEAKRKKPEELTRQLNIKDPTQTRLKYAIRLAIARSLIRVMKQLYNWDKSKLAKAIPVATGFLSEMPILDNYPSKAFYRYLLGPALILNNFPLTRKILTRYPDIKWSEVLTDKICKKQWEESDELFKKPIRAFVTTKYALHGLDLTKKKRCSVETATNKKMVSLPPEIINHILRFIQVG